jgi:hypothetical protein
LEAQLDYNKLKLKQNSFIPRSICPLTFVKTVDLVMLKNPISVTCYPDSIYSRKILVAAALNTTQTFKSSWLGNHISSLNFYPFYLGLNFSGLCINTMVTIGPKPLSAGTS